MGGPDVNKERLELALEAAGLDLWENDLVTGDVTRRASKTFSELGYSDEEALAYIDDLFVLVHPEDVDAVRAAISGHLSGDSAQYRCEFRLRAKCGTWIWYANYGKIMDRDAGSTGRRFIGVTFNIDDRKRKEDELALINQKLAEQNKLLENMNALLQSLATSDPLTRLPNRRLLLDRLKQAQAASARSGQSGALLFIDLDDFKSLNDTLGHDIGDLLLQQVGQRLELCVREGDTVARLGGDEFVVMLENLSGKELEAAAQAEAVGEKILAALNQPYRLAAHEYNSSPSIGITLFDGHRQSMDELMKQADIAMYQSKRAGRNTLCFFDPQMQDTINARVVLEGELRKALENGQFQLYYQIQMDSAYHPLGAEALIRWVHPEHGLVPPADFIPLAEQTGLILSIGQWVLEAACAQISAWQRDALTRDLVLSVNISARQFLQPGFVEQLQSVLQRHAVDPGLLKLELTESMLLENVEESIATMKALKDMGVRFALDDFGTGYSSLQYLKRLPLDQIKIDRSFVLDIVADSSDKMIVSTIIAMAQSLNLNFMAEGVETEAQRQFLTNSGCVLYQGYLFGKPVPLAEFESQLRQWETGR